MEDDSGDDAAPLPRLEVPPQGCRDEATTPPMSRSPSPALSLYSLGMPQFSPLRLHFASSPLLHSAASLAHEGARDRTQDSRDVLVQRLNDLVEKLSGDDDVAEAGVDALHATVDELETIVKKNSVSGPRKHTRGKLSTDSHSSRHSSLSARPASPPWARPHSAHEILRPMTAGSTFESFRQAKHVLPPPKAAPQHAEKVLAEAQQLHRSLQAVVTSLKARQEEQDVCSAYLLLARVLTTKQHIHGLLINRAELAAQRILYLEGRVKELSVRRPLPPSLTPADL